MAKQVILWAHFPGVTNHTVWADPGSGSQIAFLVPHLVPAGLDEFVAKVVPLLQERGVFRSAYPAGATTLRDLLGPGPALPAAQWATARKEPIDA